jgi:hypothetical protein
MLRRSLSATATRMPGLVTAAPLSLLAQSLPAMLAAVPLRTILWITSPELWIVGAAGAPLTIMGRIVNRHLTQVVASDDPDHPSLAGHRRALRGELASYEAMHHGRRWQVSVAPVRLQGEIIGCFGTGLLLPAELAAPATHAEPTVSMLLVPDAELELRAGDQLYENATRRAGAVSQRWISPAAVARLRAEGKLVPISLPVADPRDDVPPAVPASRRIAPRVLSHPARARQG